MKGRGRGGREMKEGEGKGEGEEGKGPVVSIEGQCLCLNSKPHINMTTQSGIYLLL